MLSNALLGTCRRCHTPSLPTRYVQFHGGCQVVGQRQQQELQLDLLPWTFFLGLSLNCQPATNPVNGLNVFFQVWNIWLPKPGRGPPGLCDFFSVVDGRRCKSHPLLEGMFWHDPEHLTPKNFTDGQGPETFYPLKHMCLTKTSASFWS